MQTHSPYPPKGPPARGFNSDRLGVSGWPSEQISLLEASATLIEARPRQMLPITMDGSDLVYMIDQGCVIVDGGTADDRPRVLGLLYPGDVFRSTFVPPFPGASLVTATRSKLLRFASSTLVDLERSHFEISQTLSDVAADIQRRLRFHIASLSGLPSDTRVATFLAELGLRLGSANGPQISFEIPVTRTEMASFLALNADTLSRIMSKLRAVGLITTSGRNWMTVRDISALLGHTPYGNTVRALHAPRDLVSP